MSLAQDKPAAAGRAMLWAWISVALLPLGFVAAMVLGEWLIYLQGYESGTDQAVPLGPAMLASIPAMLLIVAPAGTATWFGMRARRLGRDAGLIPAIIGCTVGIGFVGLNMLGAVASQLLQ